MGLIGNRKSLLNPRGLSSDNFMSTSGASFLPSALPNLAAWYRFNQGITVTGLGVSQWDDQSGNSRHLLQGTDADRPALQGDGSILFDGISHFLKTNTFTLVQPETVYLLVKQVTWTNDQYISDGDLVSGGRVIQLAASPDILANAGASIGTSSDLAVGAYGVIAIVWNAASSVLQVDNNTPVTGDASTNGLNGFTLGSNGSGGQTTNIQSKELVIYSVAHDAATRTQVIGYLNSL